MKQCPQCGKTFERIGQHWNASSSCAYPSFSQQQKEIIVGLLMGDGTMGNHHTQNNSYLRVQMVKQTFLCYLQEQFGILGSSVILSRTATEGALENSIRGFQDNADPSQYHDLYDWRTISHPALNQFDSWYDDTNKSWPNDTNLTPTTLKYYYVCDGSTRTDQPIIRISMSNERKNKDKVDSLFSKSGLPRPHRWNEQENQHGVMKCDAVWNVEQSKKIWNYMGPPLPGFEYKWPQNY